MTKPVDEDWRGQEGALRYGAEPADQLLMRALSQPPLPPIPEDFATKVAMLAARQSQPVTDWPEALLQYALLGLLSITGLAMAQRVLTDWWDVLPEIQDGNTASGWLPVLLLCLALSAAPGLLAGRVGFR